MAYIVKSGKKHKVYWDIGTPEKRERRSESFDTPDEAKQFKLKIEYEQSIGTFINVSKMTVGEYLDHWLNIHGPKIAEKTLESYECEIENHIKPNLGNIKLSKLSPMHIEEYYAKMRKEGKSLVLERRIATYQSVYDAAVKDKLPAKKQKQALANVTRAKARLNKMKTEGKTGLSNTTINYHHRILHKALKQAVKWQNLALNATDAVTPPTPDKVVINYLQRDKVNRFIECVKDSFFYAIYVIAILTGMRQGEILGLKWQDIDFEYGIIRVRQQLKYNKAKGYHFEPPKQHSVRDIPMPLPINAILRKAQKEQAKVKEIFLEADKPYNTNNLVFCSEVGQPLNRSRVTRDLKAQLIKYDFEHVRFHALRHTFATMCRAAGVPMEDIQDMLGHADISTTKNMYTHVEIEPLRKSMDKMTEYLGI